MQMRSKNVRFEKGLKWTLSLRPYKDLVLLNLVSDKHDVSGSIAFRDKRAKNPSCGIQKVAKTAQSVRPEYALQMPIF
jgi:hypothetical protein